MAEPIPHERRYLVKLRIAEALRETGILLFTFAPLDFAFDPRPVTTTGPIVAAALVVALSLFTLGVLAERRIYDAD